MNPIARSSAEVRAACRRGEWRGTTAGHCSDYQQANLVILSREAAPEFEAFCKFNPQPCPLIDVTLPGDPRPRRAAPNSDLRTDLPSYRLYRHGELVEKRSEVRDLWRDDLVAFLLGCSFTFEHALVEAGVAVRNIERGTIVPMFISNLPCRSAGRFAGPIVVSMRPIANSRIEEVCQLSARYPHAHGAPLHMGDPAAIGIADVNRPDFGEPAPVLPGETPVFWACGVTPQAVALAAKIDFMITHEPGQMFVTDLPREGM